MKAPKKRLYPRVTRAEVGRYTAPMRTAVALVLVLATATPIPAAAQWMWRDASGRPVFSDRPPPADIPDRNIVRRPGNAVRPVPAAPPASAASAASSVGAPAARASEPVAPAGQDPELEQRRRQAEAEEAARQKAAQEALAKARADNCQRARQAKASLDSGVRIARTNVQGEREFLDDAQRAAETRRAQDIITRDCGPMPQAQ